MTATPQIPKWTLAVDPGGMNVGLVLCELADSVLSPVDGISIKRTDAETDTKHTGGPTYARRVIQTIFELLDKHTVPDDELLVAVETVTLPKSNGTWVGQPLWQPLLGTSVILGAVAAVWPAAALIVPDSADQKDFYPAALWRHHPKDWIGAGGRGSDERKHQRSAWSVAVDALSESGAAFSAAVVSSPGRGQRSCTMSVNSGGVIFGEAVDSAGPVGVDPANLERVVVAIRGRLGSEKSSLALLAETTTAACPEVTGEALIELALAAAQAIKPTKNPAALRANLAARLVDLKLAG